MNKTLLSFVALLLLFPLQAFSASFATTYKIGPGDRIQISVYGEPDLSFDELLINSSGTFDYPYLGEMTAKGQTAQQLKLAIEKGLKGDYLITPKVMVNFISFREIYVNGEVKKPGGYEYQPGLTVDKAIALAGGFTDRAARKKINITPNGEGGTQKGVSLSKAVNPGDIIVIEQSFF